MGQQYRERRVQISFRVDENEHEFIKSRMKECGMYWLSVRG